MRQLFGKFIENLLVDLLCINSVFDTFVSLFNNKFCYDLVNLLENFMKFNPIHITTRSDVCNVYK